MILRNEAEDIRIRRYRSTLAITGLGTVAFAVWTFVKAMLGLLIDTYDLRATAAEIIAENPELTTGAGAVNEAQMLKALQIMFVILLTIVIFVRLYTGLAAVNEGTGRKKHRPYILFVYLMILENLFSIGRIISVMIGSPDASSSAAAQNASVPVLIVDATSLVLLIEMAFAAGMIRRHRSRMKRAGKESTNAA